VKIGDLIEYRRSGWGKQVVDPEIGTVVDFPLVSHAKEFQKVKVLTDGEIQYWIMQFCSVVQSAEDNH